MLPGSMVARGAKSPELTWFCPIQEDRRVIGDALQALLLETQFSQRLISNGLELSMGCHSIDCFDGPTWSVGFKKGRTERTKTRGLQVSEVIKPKVFDPSHQRRQSIGAA